MKKEDLHIVFQNDTIKWILRCLFVGLVLFIAYLLLTTQNANNEVKTVVYHDTIVIHDTIEKTVTEIQYKHTKTVDTIYLPTPDTITALPVEQKHYSDSLSDIWVSGYKPEIDSINYHIPTRIEYITKTVEVEKPKSWWDNRFIISAGVGAGYGVFTKQPDIYVGVNVGIRLY